MEEKIIENVEKHVEKRIEHMREERVKFLSKMSSKIAYLVLLAILVPIVILIVMSVKGTTNTLEETYMSYAKNLAEEAATGIDYGVDLGENTYGIYAENLAKEAAYTVDLLSQYEEDVNYDVFKKALGSVSISGIDGSYAYMVSPEGTMLYHPTKEKVGNAVENEAVKGIVEDLKAGKKVEDGFCIYEYKEAMKLAGYSFTKAGDIVIVTADYDDFMNIDYDSLVGKIEITGVEGSYAYMVSPDGTMLYHKDSEKIGKPVENAAVKGIVEDLAAGKTVENGAVVYEYKGANKLAGYAFTNKGNIIVVTADYDTFIKPITKQRNAQILTGVVLLIIFGVVGVIVISGMLKAMEKLVPFIANTANFDFTEDKNVEKISKRKDEIGLIARQLSYMQESLRAIVGDIGTAAENIDSNMLTLKDNSKRVNDMCSENSFTTENLAAIMEETSASTYTITQSIMEMQEMSKNIEQLTINGDNNSTEVMDRATKLKKATEDATNSTMNIYNDVKSKSSVAMEAAAAVSKINDLTATVMSISSQTSLLALNASIEAARAGEAGRGFAVVASEIGSLATQTSMAVKDINMIVAEINAAVDNMTECMRETLGFLENTVIEDYNSFENVSTQYQSDADCFKDSMAEIKSGILELNVTLEEILNSISCISDTMSEAAAGVSDIAGKTSDMVSETTNTTNGAKDCEQYVENLNQIVERFTL